MASSVTQLDSYINAYIVFIVIVTLGIGTGILGYFLSRLVSISKPEQAKDFRYECGNLPHGRARGWLAMQYFAYLIIFLTIEPIVIFSFTYLPLSYKFPITSIILTILIILILIPPLLFALQSAKSIDLWRVGEK